MNRPSFSRTLGAIELDGVSKSYGEERVVDNISLAIHPGEFFSLLGPSGSGKSTTLMMVAGFATVDGGAIRIDGRDIARTPPQKRGLGMVFQSYAIFPHMNVYENIAFPLRARGVSGAELDGKVKKALDLVQLGRFADKHAHALSGGQQQRVAIARAIVFSPPVVLMDEPLGALDKNLRYAMQAEIRDIQRRLGMTVIYVTHDQEEALNMSDRIAILDRGKIAQVGDPTTIYESPESRFVAQFLGEANLIEGRLELSDSGVTHVAAPGGFAGHVAPRPGFKPGDAVIFFIRPEKITLMADENAAHNGIVQRRAFLGSTIRYSVEVGQGAILNVDVANAARAFRPEIGERVGLSWRAEDASLLRPTG